MVNVDPTISKTNRHGIYYPPQKNDLMKNLSIITAVFIVLFIISCKKQESMPPSLASIYTQRMAKDWTRSRQYLYSFYMQDDIIKTYTDTVMPITVMNEEAIAFNGNFFEYYGGVEEYMVDVDTTQKLVYVDPDFPGIFNGVSGYHQTVCIEYYYHADSVVYLDITHGKRQYWEWKSWTIK